MKYFGKPKIVIIYICFLILIIISGCNVSDSISGKKELISETAITNQSNGGIRKDLNHNNLQLLDGETYQQGDDEFEINIQKVIDTAEQYNLSYSLKDINDDGLNEIIMVDVRDDVSFVVAIYAQIDGDVQVVFSDFNDASSLTYITKKGRFVNEYAFNGTNREYVLTEICFDVNYKQIFKAGYRAEFTMDVDLYKNPDIHEDGLNYYYEIYDNNRINTRNKITQESWMVGVEQLLSIEAQSFVPQWCLR